MSEHREEQDRKVLNALKRASIGMTRKEIAALLGIPKSQYVSRLLKRLAEHDLVIIKRGTDSRRRNIFIYFANDARKEG